MTYKIKNQRGLFYEGYEFERNEPFFTNEGKEYSLDIATKTVEFLERKYEWLNLKFEVVELN